MELSIEIGANALEAVKYCADIRLWINVVCYGVGALAIVAIPLAVGLIYVAEKYGD